MASKRRHLRITALLSLAPLALGFAQCTASSKAPVDVHRSAENGLIAVVAMVEDRYHLLTMRPDGSGRRDITPEGVLGVLNPSWSPDGTRLAFTCSFPDSRPIESDICKIDGDGTDFERLTRDGSSAGADWSPDGTLLALNKLKGPGTPIYLMRPDGTNQHHIPGTEGALSLGWAWNKRIVFVTRSLNIYSIRPNGTGLKQLTIGPIRESYAQWSPGGKWIAFVRQDARVCTDIYKMRRDGSDVTKLTHECLGDGRPTWSPDGSEILFISGSRTLATMKPDGSHMRAVGKAHGVPNLNALEADWQPLYGKRDQ